MEAHVQDVVQPILDRPVSADRSGHEAGIGIGDAAEALTGQRVPLTQFARAMKELNVKLILANSPQLARGTENRGDSSVELRSVTFLKS